MVPIRDVVIFRSPKLLSKSPTGFGAGAGNGARVDRAIFLSTQHDATVDEPSPEQFTGSVRSRASCSHRSRRRSDQVVVETRTHTTIRVENNNGAFGAGATPPVVNEEGVRTDALVQK
jgi:hypothetical protein